MKRIDFFTLQFSRREQDHFYASFPDLETFLDEMYASHKEVCEVIGVEAQSFDDYLETDININHNANLIKKVLQDKTV